MPANNIDMADGEIIEVFLEEVGEILENMDRQLTTWRTHPTDKVALGEIRRGFHTLKGSGRMVKAMELGELAWKMENMLNRVLDGTVQVTEPMVNLVSTCRSTLPKLVDAFKEGRKPGMGRELDALMAQAEALASGLQHAAPTGTGKGPAAALEARELQRRLDQSGQKTDEALHRAEMALQQVRRIATQLNNLADEAQGRVARTELNPLIERVNLLTRELADLRAHTRKAQTEPGINPKELQHLIDQRVRDRLATTERTHAETDRVIEETHRAAASARRLGQWALAIALIALALGGTVAAMLLGT